MAEQWIKDAVKRRGKLHDALHVKEGEKIPEKKLVKAEHSKNPVLKKEANLAKILKTFHRKGNR